MARTPKPWYWEARSAWYVQIGGKRVRLAESKKDADREFYRLMAADGKLDAKQRQRVLVADACEAMLAYSVVHRQSTRKLYTQHLQNFSDKFGGRLLTSVTPEEVRTWVSSHNGTGRKPWGEPARWLQFRYVKSLYGWARDTGLIEINPFARTANPWKLSPRKRPMEPAEYEAVISRPRICKEFKEVIEMVWRTGIRPGEIAVLAARHMDKRMPITRLQPTEHKTGTKTGLQREIYWPPDLWERLKKYAEQHKAGPIIRRPNGKPWTSSLISVYWSRVKTRMGLDCVLYQARHQFITSLIDSGVPTARVAKLAGHNGVETLMGTYYHPEAKQMAADVAAGAAAEEERMRDITERVNQLREDAKKRATQKDAARNRRKRAEAKQKRTSEGEGA